MLKSTHVQKASKSRLLEALASSSKPNSARKLGSPLSLAAEALATDESGSTQILSQLKPHTSPIQINGKNYRTKLELNIAQRSGFIGATIFQRE